MLIHQQHVAEPTILAEPPTTLAMTLAKAKAGHTTLAQNMTLAIAQATTLAQPTTPAEPMTLAAHAKMLTLLPKPTIPQRLRTQSTTLCELPRTPPF
jgi:hypothetical protein